MLVLREQWSCDFKKGSKKRSGIGSQSSRLGVQKFGDLDRASSIRGAQPRIDLSDIGAAKPAMHVLWINL